MKKLAVDIAALLLSLLYRICRVFHVRDQWVLISRQSDHASLDFQMISSWCERQDPPIKAVVLAKQLRNPLFYIPEIFRQVFYIATSKAVVLDSYCIVVSLLADTIKTPVIQIWHAMGNMKKFGYTSFGTEEGRSPDTARLMRMHKGYDAIAISSLTYQDDFAAGFNVDKSVIFEAPLPRCDLLVNQETRDAKRAALFCQYPELEGKLNIVYCPTFRKEDSPSSKEALGALIGAIDFSRYNLIYKPHPVSKLAIEDPKVISITGNDPDPLFAADFIISDYSTIIYEAGLLDVPVYLYAYDWASYKEKRGMNIDLEHDVPTMFTDDPKKIIEAIENNDFDHDKYQEFTRDNIALPKCGTCTDALCKHILTLANGAL